MGMGPNTELKEIKIDWKQVGEWLEVGCTGKECADMLGIHEDHLYHRAPKEIGTNFRTFKAKKKSHLRHFIRNKQKEVCNDKNPTMLIWLGKQYCAQKEPETAVKVTAQASAVKFLEMMETDVKKEIEEEIKAIEEKDDKK